MQFKNPRTFKNIIFNYIILRTLNLKYGVYSIILDIFSIKN